MNSKNIAKALHAKIDDWIKHIDDEDVVKTIQTNALVTGGALVSLLQGETPNDYDIYFKTLDSCRVVAEYYAKKWNKAHQDSKQVYVDTEDIEGRQRVICTINSAGIVSEDDEDGIDDASEPYVTENEEDPTQPNPNIDKPKYRPRYITSNAISLSDKIQIVIRFVGPVEEIHKNYDFEHCKCSYDYAENKVNLPVKALECIINKELFYSGSRYPLCSIIRTRKFLARGWTINAGQYVKMALELNQLDLTDLNVLKEQLVGVDSAYFAEVIDKLRERQLTDEEFKPDNTYLFEIINRIF